MLARPARRRVADRQVAEAGEDAGRGTGPELGGIFAESHVADPMETVFHAPMPSFVVVEMRGPGQIGGQAGDAVHDLLAGPDAVQAAGVAAEPEGLHGAGEQAVVGGRDADGAAFDPAVAAVVLDRGGGDPVGVRAAQQGRGGIAGDRLVALDDQNVVAVQVGGDQPGGGLGGVQRVQGPHHPGGAQTGQQVAGGGAFAALVADLALAQDRAGGVVDGGDQEDPPAFGGAGPAQRLAVHRRRGQQPVRGRVLDTALGRAALLPLGRPGRGRHHRGRCDAAGDIGGLAAERGVQRVGVQLGQHPAEGPSLGTRNRPVNG